MSFAYESNAPVLKDVCMHAQKGEIIGIVGESGCGKSTFLKLLLRFWEKDKGEIDYNGIDVDNIDSDNLLDNVTMVSQTTYLFDESIEDNLRIAKPDASQEELENACKMASVHDFIMSLPEGYKTQRADEQCRFHQRRHDIKIACRTEEQKEHYPRVAPRIDNGDSRQDLQG